MSIIYLVFYLFLSICCGEELTEKWDPVLEDHLIPWSQNGISERLISKTFRHYGSHIIYQYVNRQLYIYDPKGFCFCNNSVYGDRSIFTAHLRVCRALESLLAATVKRYNLPDFELVWSLDDIPMWITVNTSKEGLYPGFGAVRCWSKGGLALPFLGTWESWSIDTFESSLPSNASRIPLSERLGKMVFRGVVKGCSFERNTEVNFKYESAFNWTRRDCGRFKLAEISKKHPDQVDYNNEYLNYSQQASRYRYVGSVEGFGGWADRLYRLLFGDMVVFNQNHPCDQWFEPLLYPYRDFIPIAHDFRDLVGTVEWANNHPNFIENVLENANKFANTYLRRDGFLAYSYSLLSKYAKLLRYKVVVRKGAVVSNMVYNNSFLNNTCH